VIELVASLLLLALPENSQYAQSSLPASIARVIGAHAGIYRVRQFHEAGRTLWVVTLPCRVPAEEFPSPPARVPAEEFPSPPASAPVACQVDLFLQTGQGFREVGKASGELVDADPESGVPDELSFHVPASAKETQLRWAEGRLVSKQVPRWFRDPLTRERVDADELRARGMLDLQSGRFTVAAGRYALLCQDRCAVLDVETLATALLEARLFEQAAAALRRAIDMPGHQLQDLVSLISLLRAEGKEQEATVLDRQLKREDPDAGS
jgi:hypothetical protein